MSGRRPGAENRRSAFKFNAMTGDEFRRRREETTVEIRKAKREDSLNKRRNLVEATATSVGGATAAAQSSLESMADGLSSIPRASELTAAQLAQQLPNMVQALYSPDLETQHRATVEFRKVLAKERNAPIQTVVDAGVIPRFVDILAGRTAPAEGDQSQRALLESAQFEAAWVLTNIASGEAHHTMAVVQAEAVPLFISLMRHSNAEIREQCIWALGNIAGDGPKLRDYVLEENMMGVLLENVVYALNQGNKPISTVRNGAWAISNLCRGTPAPSWKQVVVALPIIFRLLQVPDEDTLVDTCWALAYMSTENAVIDEIVHAGIVPCLTPYLGHRNVSIQVPTLRAIGNIVTGAEMQTQSVIDAGALPLLRHLLEHTKVSIVKEACWALSNVTAGTPAQIQAVIDANIVPRLVHLLSVADMKVKKEACWALCNATSAYETHPQQTKYLVSQGIIKPLCAMLENRQDARLLLVILDGLAFILAVGMQEALLSPDNINPYAVYIEEAGGLNTIVALQEHSDMQVYHKAKSIIDKYYEGEEEDETIFATGEGQNTFEFNPAMPEGGFNFT